MYEDILDLLPYKSSFRFVDHITELSADGVKGDYTLRKDAFFYEDHFPGKPGNTRCDHYRDHGTDRRGGAWYLPDM
jgi:hypothetical protein